MAVENVSCSVAEAIICADQIVCVNVFRDARITVDDAHEMKSLMDKMALDKPHGVLIDLSLVHSINPEARKILATPRNRGEFHTKAVAIVVRSALSRVIANFFLGSARPGVPTRLFMDVAEARKFLLDHLKAAANP